MPKEIPNELKEKVDKIIDSWHFDVQGVPASGTTMSQEYVIKILTRLVMSICTAFWSLTEIAEYIRNRRDLREFVSQ